MWRGSLGLGAVALLVLACGNDVADVSLVAKSATGTALIDSTFESTDGDLVSGSGMDWANAPSLHVGNDLPSGNADDAYGNGTKESTEVPSLVRGSIPSNKSDLLRMYVANEVVDGRDMLYLAWVRDNVLGSANMDFELNRSAIPGPNGVTPRRSPGDILVTFDLNNGGTVPVLGMLVWLTTANGTAAECYASNALPCWGRYKSLSALGFADGSVNTTTVLDPVPHPDVTLVKEPGKGPRFGEAAINLTGSGVVSAAGCLQFTRASLHSRSSASFSSEVKDIIAPVPVAVSNCGHVTVIIEKVDPDGNPLPGAELQLFLDDGNGTHDKADVLMGECVTSSAGTCTFTVAEDGTYFGHELNPPPGYRLAPDSKVVIVQTPDPQTVTMTMVDEPIPGEIHIRKVDPSGQSLAGAAFTLYADRASTGGEPDAFDTAGTGHPTCVTDKLGVCAFVDLPLGPYWVVETEAPAGYTAEGPPYQHVVIGVSDTAGVGQSVELVIVNVPRDSAVLIRKRDPDGKPLAGAEFTLYPDNAPQGGEPDVGDTTGSGFPTCVTDKLGACTFASVADGAYWVVETSPPPGYYAEVAWQPMVMSQDPLADSPPTVDLLFINRPIIGGIFIQKRTDSGGVCSSVRYTLYPDLRPTGGVPDLADLSGTGHPTCDPDKLGQCRFFDVPLGEYWVVESNGSPTCPAARPSYQHVAITEGLTPAEVVWVDLVF